MSTWKEGTVLASLSLSFCKPTTSLGAATASLAAVGSRFYHPSDRQNATLRNPQQAAPPRTAIDPDHASHSLSRPADSSIECLVMRW